MQTLILRSKISFFFRDSNQFAYLNNSGRTSQSPDRGVQMSYKQLKRQETSAVKPLPYPSRCLRLHLGLREPLRKRGFPHVPSFRTIYPSVRNHHWPVGFSVFRTEIIRFAPVTFILRLFHIRTFETTLYPAIKFLLFLSHNYLTFIFQP